MLKCKFDWKIEKTVALFVIFVTINTWQHFGNRKSVNQNKLCNGSKKGAFSQQKLNRIV